MVLPRSKLAKNLSARRLSSTAPDLGRKGTAHAETLPRASGQDVRMLSRQAEREERMDITRSLTSPKTFMSGFTRPTDLRISDRFPGGRHAEGRRYEHPPAAAYEPHTVFLLESRYLVKHGVGRVDTHEHVIGVCPEGDFLALIERFNSVRIPASCEAMDNARWPWLSRKHFKSAVGEILEDAIFKLTEDGDVDAVEITESDLVTATSAVRSSSKSRAAGGHQFLSSELLDATSKLNPFASSRRAFHFSMRRSATGPDEPSSSAKDRSSITGSSWSRPPKPSQDADDHTVPTYYIERKRQRDSISERKEEEGGLMAELSAGILSEDVAAHTRTRDEKIPVEVKDRDGVIRHPSGFEPPTAETDFHPIAAKTATEDEPGSILSTIKQLWDERATAAVAAGRLSADPDVKEAFVKRKVRESIDNASVLSEKSATERAPTPTVVPLARGGRVSSTRQQRDTIPTSSWDTPARSTAASHDPDAVVPSFYIERKRQRDSISERKEEEGELMSELSAGILSEDLAAHTRAREEKIPVEVEGPDGVIRHPSGFEPPTAETDFHPVSSKPAEGPPKILWTDVPTIKGARRFHSSAFAQAMEVPMAQLHILSASLASPPTSLAPGTAVKKQDEFDAEEDEDMDMGGLMRSGEDVEVDKATRLLRAQYLPTLGAEPFWRPLLSLTFSTRPIAMTVARLSRERERGLAFYAAVPVEDRKCRLSFPTRMRNMRLDRMQGLTLQLARLLRGDRGGLIGARFDANDRGRGVDGERIAEPLSREQRLIKIGVGAWYARADEVQATFRDEAAEAELGDAMEVFALDERGRRAEVPARAAA